MGSVISAAARPAAGALEGALPSWAPVLIVAGVLGALLLGLALLLLRRRPKRFVYRGGIPDALGRRHVLYEQDVPAQQKVAAAEAYLAEGRLEEALEFYGHADDRAALEKMKAAALESGNAYLLGRVFDFENDLVGPADWEALAARAESLGRGGDANRARAILRGDEEPEEPDKGDSTAEVEGGESEEEGAGDRKEKEEP